MAACLLNHNINFITVFHFESIGRVIILESFSVENEAALVAGEALPLAVCIHKFFELSGSFDLKENLGSILGLHFDIDMLLFGRSSLSRPQGGAARAGAARAGAALAEAA